jgi:hypothetical protein
MGIVHHHSVKWPHDIQPDCRFRRLTLWIALMCGLCSGFAQTYPIYVTPSLTPPYSLKLSDYSTTGSQQLAITIMVRDASISNLPVKLHIKMEGSAGVVVETSPTLTTMPVYLNGGETTLLLGADLASYFNINNLIFTGYSKEQYQRTGQLPEGFYKFTVSVLHYGTNRVVSNHGIATAWIALGKPPILKIPGNGAEMGQITGMPLTFSWLPSNVGAPSVGVHYMFELWELRVPNIDPHVIVASMPALHTVQQPHTTLVVHPAELFLEQGMHYAWRVTAADPMGQIPFEQDGHSEVRTFTYQAHCDTVTGFMVEQQAARGTFQWDAGINHTSFNVEWRNPATGYLSQSQTFDSRAIYSGLDFGSTYQLRVQAVCNGDPQQVSAYSAWHTLSIPALKVDTASCPDCRCGEEPPSVSVTNRSLRSDLQPGDTISNAAGSTRYILKTVEPQADGVYKGLFWFWAEIWKVKILCRYWDLSVNTDNVILKVDYESVSDSTFLLDVNAADAYVDSLKNVITDIDDRTVVEDTIAFVAPASTYTSHEDTVAAGTEPPGDTFMETPPQVDSAPSPAPIADTGGEGPTVTPAQDAGEDGSVETPGGTVAPTEDVTPPGSDPPPADEMEEEAEEDEDDDEKKDYVLDEGGAWWVTQFNEPFFGGETCWRNGCCNRASNKILENAGASTDKSRQMVIAQTDNSDCGGLTGKTEEFKKAIQIIDKSIKEHELPIMVGVHHPSPIKNDKSQVIGWTNKCSSNIPNTTNHYIIIKGKKYDKVKKQYYYLFYEVGTSVPNNGKSSENKLYINDKSNILEGKTAYKTNYTGNYYSVIEVRKNISQTY